MQSEEERQGSAEGQEQPNSVSSRQTSVEPGQSFPCRFVILNAVLIITIFIASEMLKLIYHDVFSYFVERSIFAMIASAFWILLFLGYQVLLYEIFKKRIRRNLLWAILFILPGVLLCTNRLYQSLPSVTARRIITLAELASLPKSAVEIKVFEWSCIFSGEKSLRFRASSSDIERFLKESPVLQSAECETFSAERMRVRYTDDLKRQGKIYKAGHEMFIPDPSAPDWYKGEIKNGRLYIIQPEWGYYPGQVIVDDEEHFVYVKLVWS